MEDTVQISKTDLNDLIALGMIGYSQLLTNPENILRYSRLIDLFHLNPVHAGQALHRALEADGRFLSKEQLGALPPQQQQALVHLLGLRQ